MYVFCRHAHGFRAAQQTLAGLRALGVRKNDGVSKKRRANVGQVANRESEGRQSGDWRSRGECTERSVGATEGKMNGGWGW
jgi:hypothetical protein